MEDFYLWFTTGLQHITDWKGYDHILFIAALCGIYQWRDQKRLLLLVTAFTIGHSLTLALSVLNWIKIKSHLTEVLIPITIILTCMANLWQLDRPLQSRFRGRYIAALVFGLIHGLGFSYLLRSLLGTEENITIPLLAFNLGLEAGQLLILAGVLALSTWAVQWIGTSERDKNFFLSALVMGMAIVLLLERVI